MHRRTVRLMAVLPLLLVAGCETREVVELRGILADREKQLARMRPFADELNIARRDRDSVARTLPEVAVRETVSTNGHTPAKLLAVLHAWPETDAYAVGVFEVGADGASKATLEPIRLPEPAAVQTAPRPPEPERKPLPEPSVFSGAEGRRLRAQIERAEAELAALRRVLAELDEVSVDFMRLRTKVKALEAFSWGRLRTEPGLLDKLFGQPKPLLGSGKVEAIPGGFRASGKLAPGVSLDDLRAVVPSGFRVDKLAQDKGGVTLEATTGAK